MLLLQEAQKVLDFKKDADGEYRCLVKWEGVSEAPGTWVPLSSLDEDAVAMMTELANART